MAEKKNPNPIDRYVGSRVRMRRTTLNISQTQVADVLGLTFQQVQKYEKGSNRISASRLQHLADILQVQVPFFFEGAPGQIKVDSKAPSPAYVADFVATPDGFALIKAFMQIKDAKLRRRIVELVDEVAG